MRIHAALAILCASLSGCTTFLGATDPVGRPRTSGEMESGYTYIPVDPFPVSTISGNSCRDGHVEGKLLDALPDNAVRMLVEQFDLSGNVTYGASKAGAKDQSYRVTVDYINADTINFAVRIDKLMKNKKGELEPVDLFSNGGANHELGSEVYSVERLDPGRKASSSALGARGEFNIPVYVGVGLRVSANVYVVGANANISGIGVIGAEAEAERLRGSLVVQTLGVNGKAVAAALPIQSELNRTTAQNAIVAVGSIKALLYADETVKSPRVVGLYLPFPGGKPLVNALISELSKQPVQWDKPCLIEKTAPGK